MSYPNSYYNHTQEMNANQNTQQGTVNFNEMSEEWIFQQFVANPSEGATNTFTNSNSRDNGNDSQITSDLLAGILDNSTDNVHEEEGINGCDIEGYSSNLNVKKEINIDNIVSSNVLNGIEDTFDRPRENRNGISSCKNRGNFNCSTEVLSTFQTESQIVNVLPVGKRENGDQIFIFHVQRRFNDEIDELCDLFEKLKLSD
ncbi:UNVERIFIED_CONTAM: hypothetical protein RMT77_001023 [Armadillidium vulgare]